jgi:predicted RNA-binding Zn-ribbon protein involved in translation (DUF1610 family)
MKVIELKHIAEVTCPTCGAACITSKQSLQHSSGEWNEYRTFNCGLTLNYSPNFRRVVVNSPCTRSEEAKHIRNKRVTAIARLAKYIKLLDVDEQFKSKVYKTITQAEYTHDKKL